MRWAICRARTQVKVCTAMLLSVQWNIGENATWWGSLSCRKPNSISDWDRWPATTSATGQGVGSSWSVIRIRLPNTLVSNAFRFVALMVQVSRCSAGVSPVRSQSMTSLTQLSWVMLPISGVTCSRVRRVFPRPRVAANSSNWRPTLVRVVWVKDRAWSSCRFWEGVSTTRRVVYGTDRRVVLTHSQNLHDDQARSFPHTTLTKVGRQLDELAATLGRGKTRRTRDQVNLEIGKITHDSWVNEVIDWDLTGDTPAEHRLTWTINATKREALETRVFGKRILITDHDDPTAWPVADVVAGYRSQSEIEFGFRQLKDPHQVAFSPMFHWTDNNIAVHTFTCVLALQIAHLMRLKTERAGHHLSVRTILHTLGGIQETVLIYPSTGGRPKARRVTTDLSTDHKALYDLFNLDHWAAPTTT